MQLAIVLYDGNVGGAEKVTVQVAAALRARGVDATVVFIRDPKSLGGDLERLGVPFVTLGARRVEEVLWRPRRFALLAAAHGADGALLPAVGHQAPALRIGGYRAPIVAMEHGFLLMMDAMAPGWRLARRAERALSAPFTSVEVTVSDFMLERVRQLRFEPRAIRIHNGVDVASRPDLSGEDGGDRPLTFAHAARLIDGKGTDTLIEAFARSELSRDARLVVAGDGPERPRLERLAVAQGVAERVEFRGVVSDMVGFWSACDVAVVPPSTGVESFGMVALEAMSLGKPVVATRNGGVPEVLGADSGIVVEPGDAGGLARALDAYAADRELRREHGRNGRERAERLFSIERCADGFAGLFANLSGSRLPAAVPILEEVDA
jgi:glycosyltransferase involved in cell wall biosynthesis